MEYYKNHPREGYRALTYQMMDADVVAVSPATVYRVLKSHCLMSKWNEPLKVQGSINRSIRMSTGMWIYRI